MTWKNMKTAPRDGRQILVKNGSKVDGVVTYEYHVVWWDSDWSSEYPWRSGHDDGCGEGYPDRWMEIPE